MTPFLIIILLAWILPIVFCVRICDARNRTPAKGMVIGLRVHSEKGAISWWRMA